jgi:Carboxypeptidase regulatory-like domain
MRLIIRVVCLAVALSPLAWAQGDRGTITGTVTDQSGAVVPEAKVKAVHVGTNVERTTEASSTGDYTIPALQAGTYRIEVEARGFKTLVRNDIVLTPGLTQRVDASLQVGEVSDTVEVTAQAPLLQTDNAKINTAVSQKFVNDLPLVVGGQLRSPLDLALITPEAKVNTKAPGETFNLQFGGGQEGGWDATLDGLSSAPAAPFEQRLWTMINTPSVEAIDQFSVDTNGFKAEFGRAGGGAVSFVSKSGTNELHGNVFEFLRNEALDASNFFFNATNFPEGDPRRRPKQKLRQHDFGFSLGGPVWIPKVYNGKNKTFFFTALEYFRNRTSAPVNFYTIPLPEMYNGDFSNWKDAAGNLIPIYDPRTTRPNPNGTGFIRDPFTNNQIPAERLSRVSRNIIPLATMRPNLPGPRNNFVTTVGARTDPWDKFDVKVDHVLTSKDKLGFLYHYGATLQLPVGGTPPGLPSPLNQDFQYGDTHTYVYRLTWDRTISPTVLNHFSGGVNNWWQVRRAQDSQWDQGWGTKIGITNVPNPDWLFPQMNMTDYKEWGRSEWGGSLNKNFAFSDDLTWVKGSHALKFGFMFQEDHYNGYGWHTATGTWNFTRGATAAFLPNGTIDQSAASGNAFASLLLGEVNTADITTNRFVSDQWKYYAGYAQDDWRVNPKLTLNYGVRYEYTPPTVEGRFPDGYSNFNPTKPNPYAPGRLGAMDYAGFGSSRIGSRTMYPAWRGGIGPRLGLAYSWNDKTVIRMSASRSFGPVRNTGGSSHWQGFIGEHNVPFTSQATGKGGEFNWDNGYCAGCAWPRPDPNNLDPGYLNRTGFGNVPYWQARDSARMPEFYNWSFNIQRQLSNDWVVEMGYNATMGHHLTTNIVAINQLDPAIFDSYVQRLGFATADSLFRGSVTSAAAQANGITVPYPGFNGSVAQSLRPFPQYNDIATGGDGGDRSGNSSYHAMVLKLEKRYSNGLQLLSSYVISKFFTDAETANAATGAAMNHYNRSLEKSLSVNDQTHNLKFNYSYELPWGPGRKYLNSGVLSHIIGGWRMAGILNYYSGIPLGLAPGYNLPLFGNNRISVADYEGWRATPKGDEFDPFVDRWWDASVVNSSRVQGPPAGAKVYVLESAYGNATKRNPKERSAWTLAENLSIARTFRFSERVRMDFRWEMFNAFNRVRWGLPSTSDVTNPNFGLVNSQGNTPRQMQFGLKVEF